MSSTVTSNMVTKRRFLRLMLLMCTTACAVQTQVSRETYQK